MKKVLTIIAAVFILTVILVYSQAFGQPARSISKLFFRKPSVGAQRNWNHPFTKGLIAHWLLNEGSGSIAYDSSLYGNHGMLQNHAFPSDANSGWKPGHLGVSLEFDGSNDYIEIAANDLFTLVDGYSISFWVFFPSVIAADDHVVSRWGGGGPGNASWAVWIDSAKLVTMGNHDGAATSTLTTDATDIQVGFVDRQSYVCAVYAGGTTGINAYIYVDGSLQISGTLTNTPQQSNLDIRIGDMGSGAAGFHFDGIIDNVRIYNRPLSASEVSLLHREPFADFFEELYFPFALAAVSRGQVMRIIVE